jgi:hypothetical protein
MRALYVKGFREFELVERVACSDKNRVFSKAVVAIPYGRMIGSE